MSAEQNHPWVNRVGLEAEGGRCDPAGRLHLLPLTDEQRRSLQPLFDEVQNAAETGPARAIFAQVWKDAAVLKVLTVREAEQVQAVLGGCGGIYCSAAERMTATKGKTS